MVTEAHLTQLSGLRVSQMPILLSPSTASLMAATAVSGTQSSLTTLASAVRRLTSPQTPCVTVRMTGTPAAWSSYFFAVGYSIFGEEIVEITPEIGLEATAINFVWFSRAFASVKRFGYMATAAPPASTTVELGCYPGLRRDATGATYNAADNWGFATPRRFRDYPPGGLREIPSITVFDMSHIQTWKLLDTHIVQSRSSPGWDGDHHKWTIDDFDTIVADATGAAPLWDPDAGDVAFIFPLLANAPDL